MSIGTRAVALSVLALARHRRSPLRPASPSLTSRRRAPGSPSVSTNRLRASAGPWSSAERGVRQRGLPRPRRLEARARPRGPGGRLGLAGGRVLRPLGRRTPVRALVSRTRYYWSVRVWAARRPRERLGRADVVRDGVPGGGEWRGRWIAGPERPPVRSAAEGEADDAAIRAAGEFCRPGPLADPRLRRGALSRTTRASAARSAPRRCCASRSASTSRSRRARVYSSGLAYNDLAVNGTPVSDERARPRLHRLQPDRPLHDPRRDRPPAARART